MEVIAIVEIGSRAIRLLVAAVAPTKRLSVIHKDFRSTRLAAAVSAGAARMSETLKEVEAVVQFFLRQADDHRPSRTFVFGTASFRAMPSDVLERFRLRLPIFRVMSARGEACCSLVSSLEEFTSEPHGTSSLVVDQGTGSVETAYGSVSDTGVDLYDYETHALGTQNLATRFIGCGRNIRQLTEDLASAMSSIGRFAREWPGIPVIQGSTGTKIAQLQSLARTGNLTEKYRFDLAHGKVFSAADLEILVEKLHEYPTVFQRLLSPGGKDEFDLFVAGVVGLRAISEALKVQRWRVSAFGTRHGAALLIGVYQASLTDIEQGICRNRNLRS